MKFPAKGGSDFEPVPAGAHLAICNGVVDLGLQAGSAQYPEPKHMMYIRFELPNERISFERDGKKVEGPMSIGRRFTASMNKKANLRKFIEGMFGKSFPSDDAAGAFDHTDLIDKKCLLTVTHDVRADKTYANVSGASPIPKGMPKDFKRENDVLIYDLSAPDDEMFERLPKWLQDTINKRLDGMKEPATTGHATQLTGKPTGNLPGFQPFDRANTTDTDEAEFDDEIPF